MGIVMIRCPTTGRAISTGIKTDASSFNRALAFFAYTRCPICKIDHEWFAADAWVSEACLGIDQNSGRILLEARQNR